MTEEAEKVTLFLAKIHDDNTRVKSYANDLLTLVRKEFITRKISTYDYERFVNILTCLCLQTDESKREIDFFINHFEFTNRKRIDVRV